MSCGSSNPILTHKNHPEANIEFNPLLIPCSIKDSISFGAWFPQTFLCCYVKGLFYYSQNDQESQTTNCSTNILHSYSNLCGFPFLLLLFLPPSETPDRNKFDFINLMRNNLLFSYYLAPLSHRYILVMTIKGTSAPRLKINDQMQVGAIFYAGKKN